MRLDSVMTGLRQMNTSHKKNNHSHIDIARASKIHRFVLSHFLDKHHVSKLARLGYDSCLIGAKKSYRFYVKDFCIFMADKQNEPQKGVLL